ncbi:APA family basic amino acid/polyamine antiporter [Chitinophaga skermanii]|uniref:APA family basic amino acid/polyamine antiporter n=1 Tax=Chitinophaga skermanii TaxID=331697 RepID=A0A327QDP2_9BACT|nr:amino acid permease [Chitinophaga skermanii]RAI99766.1 APA family basic amino acid/polyamine antiporter [Chitinophaga skermanii]
MSRLFVKKPLGQLLNEASESEKGLKRTLSANSLIALGIGAIIGAGLFSLTGLAAANNAGPAVTISFIIGAIGCAFAGLCYAEFASMIPIAGSAYTYSYATMGEFIAWIIGWDLVLEYALGAATVSISWSQYLVKFLHHYNIHLPAQLTSSPFETVTMLDGSVVHGWLNLPAVLIVVCLSMLLIKGTKESAFINGLLVALKVAVVLVFIAVGWGHINQANYDPYIPANTGEFGHFGWSGVFRGAAVVFFAFIGFDAVSTAAQEAKNPQRDMPRGILGSLLICTILYVLFAHVMTGLAHYTEFAGSAAPVAVAIEKTPYEWLKQAIIVAILAGYTSVILVMLMGQSRVFYSMSMDGLLPKSFATVHKKFRTPYKSNLLFMVFVSLFSAFVPVNIVGEMVSIGTLFAFVLVCVGVMVMRKSQPDVPRPFKTPLVPIVPILGIIICFALMASLPFDTWLRLAVWMALGVIIYFAYSKKNSVLGNKL